MAPLVPSHDPPAGVGQQRGEDVEGAGEVEAAVEQRERRCGGAAPLVDGDADAVGVDLPHPVGRPGPGVLDEIVHCAVSHLSSLNGQQP